MNTKAEGKPQILREEVPYTLPLFWIVVTLPQNVFLACSLVFCYIL